MKTAEADAREVAILLKGFYGFETRLLPNTTRQQIVSALFSYRQTLGPEANLLVCYAGHGINDQHAEKSYWLPVDAIRDDDSNWISADDITTRIRAIWAKHVLVILTVAIRGRSRGAWAKPCRHPTRASSPGFSTARELITLRRRVQQCLPDAVVLLVTAANYIRDNSRAFSSSYDEEPPLPYFRIP